MGAVESGTRVTADTDESCVFDPDAPGTPDCTAAVAGYDDDTFAYIVGFEASLPAGFGIAAAYKGEELDNGTRKYTQDSYSIIGQYWNGPIGVKVGYAANLEADLSGTTASNSKLAAAQTDDSNTISAQLMAVHNGFVPYLRVAGRTVGDADTDIVTRVGLEYGF